MHTPTIINAIYCLFGVWLMVQAVPLMDLLHRGMVQRDAEARANLQVTVRRVPRSTNTGMVLVSFFGALTFLIFFDRFFRAPDASITPALQFVVHMRNVVGFGICGAYMRSERQTLVKRREVEEREEEAPG